MKKKYPVVSVKKEVRSDGYVKWAICHDGKPMWWRSSKQIALKHAAGHRRDLRRM